MEDAVVGAATLVLIVLARRRSAIDRLSRTRSRTDFPLPSECPVEVTRPYVPERADGTGRTG